MPIRGRASDSNRHRAWRVPMHQATLRLPGKKFVETIGPWVHPSERVLLTGSLYPLNRRHDGSRRRKKQALDCRPTRSRHATFIVANAQARIQHPNLISNAKTDSPATKIRSDDNASIGIDSDSRILEHRPSPEIPHAPRSTQCETPQQYSRPLCSCRYGRDSDRSIR